MVGQVCLSIRRRDAISAARPLLCRPLIWFAAHFLMLFLFLCSLGYHTGYPNLPLIGLTVSGEAALIPPDAHEVQPPLYRCEQGCKQTVQLPSCPLIIHSPVHLSMFPSVWLCFDAPAHRCMLLGLWCFHFLHL